MRITIFLFLFVFISCSKKISDPIKSAGEHEQTSMQEKEDNQILRERSIALAKKFMITDGHIDLPYRLRVQNFRLEKEYIGIPIETDKGDFDYKRCKEGGLDAPFMSIYIPASTQTEGTSKVLADSLIDMVHGIIEAHPSNFGYGNSVKEVEENFAKGIVSLPMGMENGAPIMDDLDNVDYFHNRGIRYITLTHSKVNQICDSSYDTIRKWNGLSPFGIEVVKRMNEVGVMVDVSHISDSTFYQVMELSKVPCVASHSSVRKYVPGFERNMSDDMIRLMGEKGGVIQINFGSTFLDGDLQKKREAYHSKITKMLEGHGLMYYEDEAKPLIEKYEKENPESFFSDVEKVVDHIDHVVDLAGIDHVGFGSDFDGVGDTLPTGLKDVSDYPNVIYEMLKRGYSEEDIAKVCYKNVLRVWKATEAYAASH